MAIPTVSLPYEKCSFIIHSKVSKCCNPVNKSRLQQTPTGHVGAHNKTLFLSRWNSSSTRTDQNQTETSICCCSFFFAFSFLLQTVDGLCFCFLFNCFFFFALPRRRSSDWTRTQGKHVDMTGPLGGAGSGDADERKLPLQKAVETNEKLNSRMRARVCVFCARF